MRLFSLAQNLQVLSQKSHGKYLSVLSAFFYSAQWCFSTKTRPSPWPCTQTPGTIHLVLVGLYMLNAYFFVVPQLAR